ncbi:MAG: phosphodiester glycosidase family protein [Candidatus Riflebacteria bacterium]|nr:phosphodiester glycosidase family protein [Candidatus Riflebacteria bacterium]
MKMKVFFFFIVLLVISCNGTLHGETASGAVKLTRRGSALKPLVRELFGEISEILNAAPRFTLPEGASKIVSAGAHGVRFQPGRFELRIHVWTGEGGLQDEMSIASTDYSVPVAAINGTFFCDKGPLGQVIVDGVVPRGITQIPGRISRCFVASIAVAGGKTRWVIGETDRPATALIASGGLDGLSLFSGATAACGAHAGESVRWLLGGAGWIVRAGKDVHLEAYQRQRFQFRKVDQDSRHSVIALDSEGGLLMIVFETGLNLEAVSRILLTQPQFKGITDAIFFDGGSSSELVVGREYLVSPLYLVDKARFTAITIVSCH